MLPVDGILDGLAGNDIFAFLATLIPHPELLLGAIFERPLVIQNELIPVFGLQGDENDV
jgi:hypothetical protein